jgi:hypothetical protein
MNCILHHEVIGGVIVYLNDTFLTDPLWDNPEAKFQVYAKYDKNCNGLLS